VVLAQREEYVCRSIARGCGKLPDDARCQVVPVARHARHLHALAGSVARAAAADPVGPPQSVVEVVPRIAFGIRQLCGEAATIAIVASCHGQGQAGQKRW
jgi:hypothetical protein